MTSRARLVFIFATHGSNRSRTTSTRLGSTAACTIAATSAPAGGRAGGSAGTSSITASSRASSGSVVSHDRDSSHGRPATQHDGTPGVVHLGEHAIVIGASIGGLTAARVLADRFDRVTVIDRDALPAERGDRQGVPQGRHGHGLLASGYAALEGLFPNIASDLRAAGAIHGDVVGDVRWFHHGCYKAKFESGLKGFLMSRALLEGAVRARVRQLRNVRILDKCHVETVIPDDAGARIAGVRVHVRPGVAAQALAADLVIDASGHTSRSPEWLAALGYETPPSETIAVDVTYATRLFERRAADLDGDHGVVIAATPPDQTRLGFMLAVEGNRWMVSLGGCIGERPPSDPNGYLEFARSLPTADIFEVIRKATPVGDIVRFAFPTSRRRRYERVSTFPERYVVIGDALCAVNPIFGQGMSVAALEALELRRCLNEPNGLDQMWRRLFRRTAAVIDSAWQLAAGNDLAYPALGGRRRPVRSLRGWYVGRVHRAAASDRVVCRAFFDVVNLLAPPSALIRPAIALRVARHLATGMRPSASYRDIATKERR
jgi:2-polyprenyl-6-methoxyphenol hydroxylase-like FAD-dependent oxidoreductase